MQYVHVQPTILTAFILLIIEFADQSDDKKLTT